MIRPKVFKYYGMVLLFVLLGCLVAIPVLAQQNEVNSQVMQIAGSTVYLSSGSDDGIAQGDTLYIYRDERFLGVLIVIGVASKSLSADFGDKTFALTRGQMLTIRFQQPVIQPAEEPKKPQNVTAPVSSVLNRPTEKKATHKSHVPRVNGRISIGGSAMGTLTKWSDVQNTRTDRLYLTPYTNFSALISDLPGGFSLDASAAYSYRYSNRYPISPASWARFYRLNAEKSFSGFPLTITAGRFYNRYEIFSGFWDGVMAKVGSMNNGIGFIAGFEPVRSDEGFQMDLPKYSAYTYQEFRKNKFRSSTELDFTAVMPRINLDNHLYAGAYQQFVLGRTRLSARLQVDQNPTNNQWAFSQIMVRGSAQLSSWFELHGGYNQRQPYLMYAVADPIGYRHEEWSGGTRFLINSGSVGADVSRITSDFSPTAYSVSAYFQGYQLRFWDLGLSANGQYWMSKSYNTLRLAPSLTHDFGSLHFSMGYEFYRTDYLSGRYITHSLDFSIMTALGSKWYFQTNLRTGYSQLFLNNGLQFSLWRSF